MKQCSSSLVLLNLLNRFAGDAAVKGYKIHSILGVEPDHINKVFGGKRGKIPLIMDYAVIDGTVPIMAGHSLTSFCRKGWVLPWEDRSMIASAPISTAAITFCISTS